MGAACDLLCRAWSSVPLWQRPPLGPTAVHATPAHPLPLPRRCAGCNLCGQLGHQAAQCTTGTVDWPSIYGPDVFKVRKAVFQSDIDAAKKAKQINFEDLERRARNYAKVGGCGRGGVRCSRADG